MTRCHVFFCRLALASFALTAAQLFNGCQSPAPEARAATHPPNVVIIFCDDLGYADITPFGGDIPTPHLSRLAREGRRFTDFYVAQAVCSASRAALLTGCYPNRIGIQGALGPKAKVGIHSNEVTMAEVLKGRGYATAIYGKWHLGHEQEFLPTRHGFDDWYGLPYSNDMWPFHPTGGTNYPPLPLYENERVVEVMPDQRKLTAAYTERAVKFIERNRDRPFFLYLPHAMPHVPLFVSEKFDGKSRRGLYGDVLQEIDWSVGEILSALRRSGLDDNTLVIFTSDNGPWLSYGTHAGAATPLREGKGNSFEGGVRVPFIARWPGRIPANSTCREMALAMDLLPTVAKLAGTNAPTDRVIDGRDIWPLLAGTPGATTPHEVFFCYWGKGLEAVRAGKWKLHLGHDYQRLATPGDAGKPGRYARARIGVALFDLEKDVSESRDVAKEHPEVVARLQQLAERARADLGDALLKRAGANVREPGRL